MMKSHEDMIEIRDTLAILRRQRRFVLMTVLLLLGAAFTYVSHTTALYTATALIRIAPHETNLLDTEVVGHSNAAVETSRLDTEVEILRSSRLGLQTIAARQLHKTEEFGPTLSVLDKVRLALGEEVQSRGSPEQLTNQTLERFLDALTVRRKGMTYLVAVSVTSADPKQAADLANTHARLYISDQVAMRVDAAAVASGILRNELRKSEQRLAASNEALRVYVADNLDRLTAEANSKTLDLLRTNFQTNASRMVQTEVLLSKVDSAFGRRDWQQLATQIGDQSLHSLEAQRQALRLRLQGRVAQPQQAVDLQALDLQAEIARIEADLELQAASAVEGLQGDLRQLNQDQDAVLVRIQSELAQTGLSAQTLTEIYALNQDALIAQRQYDQLINRLRDFEAQAVVQVADSQLVAEALHPNTPSFPKPKLVFGVALLLGIGLGGGLAFVKEYNYGGVTSAHQLANVIGAKVGAVVPRVSAGRLADQVVVDPMSQFSEAFRKLRAGLDHGWHRHSDRHVGGQDLGLGSVQGMVILVTSAIPAEGKSTSALALARTYAQAGKRTLLIDADLRKPSIHTLLREEPELGLLQYLQSHTADDQSCQEGRSEIEAQFYVMDPLSKLGIILGGSPAIIPTDTPLQSAAFRSLVDNARSAFEVVVIDSAPLLPVVDTRYLAPLADAAVVCVRYADSTQTELRSMMAQLRDIMADDAMVLGLLTFFGGVQKSDHYGGYYSG